MLIKLIRNQSSGSAITGRLVIDGRWFCNTLERTGYQILALCYPVRVTQSPKFKRLLPIVQNVPQRSGIRFHRGSKPEHSTGCVLVLADNSPSRSRELIRAEVVENKVVGVVDKKSSVVVGSRTSADVEKELTQLLLKAQNAHEEIILEVIDFTPGTDLGSRPCPHELQQHVIDSRHTAERYNRLHSAPHNG